MKKRVLSLLLAVTMVAGLLAGCVVRTAEENAPVEGTTEGCPGGGHSHPL